MKVGKQNFVPPPKVESSVVRIEPKMPRPTISWEEWDGMLRICFLRKHKTLRALWTAPKVRAMVEHNWVMHVSLNGDDAIPNADLEGPFSEQIPAECDNVGDEDEELVDIPSEGEEDDLPSARLDLQSTLYAIVTLGAHKVPRSRISALVSQDPPGIGANTASQLSRIRVQRERFPAIAVCLQPGGYTIFLITNKSTR